MRQTGFGVELEATPSWSSLPRPGYFLSVLEPDGRLQVDPVPAFPESSPVALMRRVAVPSYAGRA